MLFEGLEFLNGGEMLKIESDFLLTVDSKDSEYTSELDDFSLTEWELKEKILNKIIQNVQISTSLENLNNFHTHIHAFNIYIQAY